MTIPATVPQMSEIPAGLINYPVYRIQICSKYSLSCCHRKLNFCPPAVSIKHREHKKENRKSNPVIFSETVFVKRKKKSGL